MHDEKNRMETINEIVPKDQRDSFYSTFGIYHNNWKDLGKCFKAFETRIHMKFSDTSYMKGFASLQRNQIHRDVIRKRHYISLTRADNI